MNRFIFLTIYYEQMELLLLILVCIHKSHIVYLKIYVVPIGHGFSFFCHGKSMLKKRGTLDGAREGTTPFDVK